MKIVSASFADLSDNEVLAASVRLAGAERQATAELVAVLMEMDARGLYLGEGFSSLFTYCTGALHLSEHAAYDRIQAARATRRFPAVLEHLAEGSLTLATICLLSPHLTDENHAELLATAKQRSKREVERMVAALRPLPAVPSSVRRLPEPGRPVVAASTSASPGESPRDSDLLAASGERTHSASPIAADAAPAIDPPRPTPRAIVKPLALERYKVQVTISRAAYDHLRRAQDLLRHALPNGDPAAIVERALALLVENLERTTRAAATRPRPARPATTRSRHIPAAVKREVWARDGGRCAFIGTRGRCAERGFLELHHVVPFADGGASDATNLQLRCRAHNTYEAELWFGPSLARERSPQYASSPRREFGSHST